MGEKESKQINYEVAFGVTFNKYYSLSYSQKTVELIDDFIDHYELNGLKGWKGKVAPSNRVPATYPNREELIKKANIYKLWHAHIGDPQWHQTTHGKFLTSEWVLQFKKVNKYKIVLLELSWHKPMLLPNDQILNEE